MRIPTKTQPRLNAAIYRVLQYHLDDAEKSLLILDDIWGKIEESGLLKLDDNYWAGHRTK